MPKWPKPMRPQYRPSSTSQFSTELRHEVAAYLDRTRDHRFGNAATWFKAGGLLECTIPLFIAAFNASAPLGFPLRSVAAFLAAVLLSVNVMHDASHSAMFKSRLLNTLAMRT